MNKLALEKEAEFRRAFHSEGFVLWMKSQGCYVTGRYDQIQVAHTIPKKKRHHRGTWRDTVPLHKKVHEDFDSAMSDERFLARYEVSRNQIKTHGPGYYQAKWEEREMAH